MLPLVLAPLLKSRIWGGHRIEPYLSVEDSRAAIGEAWLLADLAAPVTDGVSPIVAGHGAGGTLHDVLTADGDLLMGRAARSMEGGFPLLVKLLDAEQPLSVQVHPTRAYAASHPGAHLKSEGWLVLQADPGATLYRGIRPNVHPSDFRAHIADGTLIRDLVECRVHAGQAYWLPSGTCHALGAGAMVAEYQTPSDTTFRVFDWGRNDSSRPLHTEQAMECLLFGSDQSLSDPDEHAPWIADRDGVRSRSRLGTEFFTVREVECASGRHEIPRDDTPAVWTLIAGAATLESGSWSHRLGRGGTFVVPAEADRMWLSDENETAWLVASLPDALARHDDRDAWVRA